MNLYLISQRKVTGFDVFDSAIVAATSPDDARKIHPSSVVTHIKNEKWMGTYSEDNKEYIYEGYNDWINYIDKDQIKVEFLGKTEKERGVILTSFKAG